MPRLLQLAEAENTAAYLTEAGFQSECVHSGLRTKVRDNLLERFRQDDGFDVLVGVNLLREGLTAAWPGLPNCQSCRPNTSPYFVYRKKTARG